VLSAGGDRVVRATITPLMSGGSVAGAVALFGDETESERLEATRRDYVANVSHELRTPIASVRAMAEALHDGMIKKPEDQQRYHGLILTETLRLSRLIDDLLELSRLQSGKDAMEKVAFSLEDLLADYAERAVMMADDVDITFVYEKPDEAEGELPLVLGNPDRVEQVLTVLVSNAVKFTPKGGRIALSAEWRDADAVVCVRDTGPGIDAADIPHIFDRFYKADRAHSGGGTGLGLSIAQEIASRTGESLWVESGEGQGAAFFFTVSLAEPVVG